MALFHVFNTVDNRATGVPMAGVQVRAKFDDTDIIAPIYADQAGAAFDPANTCVTDADGMFSFYIDSGEYKLEFLVGDAVIKTIRDFRPAEVGPSGPANSTYGTTAELESADVANVSAILAETGKVGTFTTRDYADFSAQVAADTGKVNYIRSVFNPTKAWVRTSILSDAAGKTGASSGLTVDAELALRSDVMGTARTDTNMGTTPGGILSDNGTAKGWFEESEAAIEARVTTEYQPAIPAEPGRFTGANAAAKLAAAITAQAGKTVTIVTADDTTALPADFTGAAIDYAADREGRWTHVADTFGKARRTLKAQHPAHSGEAMATLHIETEAIGNANGPTNADYGASIAVTKQGFGTGSADGGEIDGLTIFVRQDGIQDSAFAATDRSDVAGILINAQKIGTCGWLGAIELGASELDPGDFSINRQVQAAMGVITGIEDNRAYGLTATALYGACDYGILVYEDSASGGTWEGLARTATADGTQFIIGLTGDMRQVTPDWTDWSWRLTRPDSTDGPLSIENRGTGGILISASDAAPVSFATNGAQRARFNSSGHFEPTANLGINVGTASNRFAEVYAYQLNMGASAVDGCIFMFLGASPEGLVAANVGSLVVNTAGGGGTRLYSKITGTGNTGWAPIA